MRFLDLNMLALGEVGQAAQPGLSSFQAGKWLHGKDAFAVFREDPQSVCFTVWENLSLEPAGLKNGMRHFADLAMAQLQSVCKDLSRDCWTVFTPVHWNKVQLQVFLGVAAACKMDVRVLMPRVLAANHLLGESLSHWTAWEWQWSQLFRVELVRDSRGWQLKHFHSLPEAGVLDLFKRESRVAAKWALETNRVDPLHSGTTEQKLFEGWWNWHRGAGAWIYASGDTEINFAEESERFTDLHRQRVPEVEASSFPFMLGHILGWSKEHVERSDVEAIESRLGDYSQPGARWKEILSSAKVEVPTHLPVTHWLIAGMAERVRENVEGIQPGDLHTLADGREALAIHVPEE